MNFCSSANPLCDLTPDANPEFGIGMRRTLPFPSKKLVLFACRISNCAYFFPRRGKFSSGKSEEKLYVIRACKNMINFDVLINDSRWIKYKSKKPENQNSANSPRKWRYIFRNFYSKHREKPRETCVCASSNQYIELLSHTKVINYST